MKFYNKNMFRLAGVAMSFMALQACNKEFNDIEKTPAVTTPSGTTINDIINTDTTFSFLKAAVAKAGISSTLANASLGFTFFAPDNNAFRTSGFSSIAVINSNAAIDTASLRSLLLYNIIPQKVTSAQLSTAFPNFQYPSLLNPAPTVSPFLRLTTFPSKRSNGAWVNNIPITATDITAVNGVMHKTFALVAPPKAAIYDSSTKRILNDTTLSFFVAALQRADSGLTTIAQGSLLAALREPIGPNLTVFAPTNDAFRNLQRAMGVPEAMISPQAVNSLPVQTVRAIVAYHILGTRAFSVNFPTTATFFPTLLNGSVSNHPGVKVQVTFAPNLPFVGLFTVTSTGLLDPRMAPLAGTATVVAQDLHATNGVVHKINKVLIP